MRKRGGKISIKNKSLLISVLLIFVMCISAVAATDVNDCVDNQNLNDDNVSDNLKVSISETNLVNSHDDNLTNYPQAFSAIEDNNNSVSLNEDSSYKSSNSRNLSTNGSSNGNGLNIITNNLTMEYLDGSYFNATVTDDNGTPMSGVKVNFTIDRNGNKYPVYTVTTDSNGVASLLIRLAPGTYTITVSSPNAQPVISTLIVKAAQINIGANDLNMFYNDGNSFNATVTNSLGKPLSNVVVTFTIYNSKGTKYPAYTVTTNANGVASLPIRLAAGTYKMVLSVPYAQSVTKAINVKTVQYDLNAKDLSMSFCDGSDFKVKVTYGNKPVSGVVVTFTIYNSKGTKYPAYTATTDANGVASLAIRLAAGTYKMETTYNGLKVSNNIKIVKANSILSGNDVVDIKGNVARYNVTLTSATGTAINGVTINFKINGKTYSAVTNANGVAFIDIKGLDVGNYKLEYNFAGNGNYNPSNNLSYLKVINSTTILSGKDANIIFGDDYSFNVTVKDVNGTVISNKNVTFEISGSSLGSPIRCTVKTDSNGVASLPIRLHSGTFVINYFYSVPGQKDYNFGSNTIVVNKQMISISADELTKQSNETSSFDVHVKDKNNAPLKGIVIQITVAGVTYNVVSNDQGIASLRVTLQKMGVYDVTYKVDPNIYNYTSNVCTSKIIVDGAFISGKDSNVQVNKTNEYAVTVTNVTNNPVAGKDIKFVLTDSKGNVILDSTVKTDSKGVAKITLPKLNAGTYTISYTYVEKNIRGQSIITVSNGIPLNAILTAANNLKKYIEGNSALPSTVTVDGKSYSTSEFLYLLAKATIALKNGDKSNIFLASVMNPSNPSIKTVTGDLYLKDYLVTAQNIIDYIDKNGIAPDSINTALGSCGYEPLVYAFSRIVAFYQNNGNILPNYVTLKSVSVPVPSSPLNDANTIPDSELSKYLESGGWKCDVDNPQIKQLAAQLTAGMTSELAKATAIYNYVRDQISYSFYYNSKYGATNTLFKYKTGNCCDKANALVALLRAANIHARYVHGSCTFSSGSTYGHVWVQVLIGDTWVVADPTSTRNSFGQVVNWNNNRYTLYGKYPQLSF